MKKVFSAAMAAVLSMSMAFSSLAATKLEAPTMVRWSENQEAAPEWSRVEGAAGEYQVEGYKDGTRFYDMWHSFSATNTDEVLEAGGFINELKESGIYKFRVMARGDGNNTEDSDWSPFSEDWSFTKADVAFGTPSNLHWDGTAACWDEPEIPEEYQPYLLGYEVELYGDGRLYITHNSVSGSSFDQAAWMDEEGVKEYTFAVRAISSTPSKIFHGAQVKCGEAYDVEDTKADVSGKLDEILSSGDENAVVNAPDTLSKDIKSLQVAMQSDAGVLQQVEDLETAYTEKTGVGLEISTEDNVNEIAPDDVKIVGAVLNADGNNNHVVFHISKPARESVVDDTAYKNCIQFDFKLRNAVSTLKVPVRITVPIPESINPRFFRILHDHGDGKPVEIDPFTVAIDDTVTPATASFTVTSFSTFIFAEAGADFEKITTPSNADKFMKLANTLPDSLNETEEEEKEGVKIALAKLMDALKNSGINASIKNQFLKSKENEAVLNKISSLLLELEGDRISLVAAEEIEAVDYYSAVAGILGADEEVSMQFNFELATSSNAKKNFVFNISMELDGEETIELLSPLKFYITMPEGYTYNKNDTITVPGGKAVLSKDDDGRLVIFTTRLGTFTITKRSGTGSVSSGSGGRSTPSLTARPTAGGKWVKDGNNYSYYYSDGSLASNCWIELTWNNTTHWYHFNISGIMDTGWIKDNAGNWYYLNASANGVYGSMLTGWNFIDGKWYYFNEKSDGFKGTLLTNATTPDGYWVNSDGVWVP